VTAAAEFNTYCDAEAARYVFGSPVTKTLLPLDLTMTAELDIGLLDQLPEESTGVGRVLRAILPGAFRAYRQQLGVEAIFLPEAVAVVAVLHPELFTTERFHCDVETGGGLTHGATVVDRRRFSDSSPNMDVVVEFDVDATIDCMLRTFTAPR